MIALIVMIILSAILILGLVSAFIEKWCIEDKIIFSVLLFGCISLFVVALIGGKSIYKQDTTELLKEKTQIEYLLENNFNEAAIKMAEKYNEKVDSGNDYFFRFDIENRSEFKISLEKYYEKGTETPAVEQKIAHLEEACTGNYMNFSCNTTVVVYESSILINKNGSRVEYILFQDDSGVYYTNLAENISKIYLSFGVVYVDQGDNTFKNVTTVMFENTIYSRYELL